MPLANLNEEQFKAATAPKGYNLVIASAGTGKTSTIVARIAYLLQNGVDPSRILLLTFTNKASQEMINRVGRYFDKGVISKIEAGTFHSVSYRFLKKLGKKIVLKQPKDLKILLKSIYDKRDFNLIDSDAMPYSSSYLYDIYSLYNNTEQKLSFGEWIGKKNDEQSEYALAYEDILNDYEEEKRRFGYVEFNDLLIYMKLEAKKSDDIWFDEILVDEYQDTNALQNSLIDSFKSSSLFCVGDYDQSIYAFNGADINIIASFTKRYGGSNVYTLNKNYRSVKPILSLANRVIEKNPRIYPKSLQVTRGDSSKKPRLLVYENLFIQYENISKLIKNSDTLHEEIAVLYRNNSSADGVEAYLRENGISCKRKGGFSFFDSKEIKAFIDLVSIVANPKDMMAFIHIFEYGKGIGGVFSKDLFEALYNLGNGNIKDGFLNPDRSKSIYNKLVSSKQLGLFESHPEFGSVVRFSKLGFDDDFLSHPILKHQKMTKTSAKYLYELYKFIKKTSRIKQLSTLMSEIYNSNIFKEIASILAKKRAISKDGSIDQKLYDEKLKKIYDKVKLLIVISKDYRDIERFLNALTLGSSEMSEGRGVNLMSVHASKGLEFKEVYIIDLMEGRFPNRKLIAKGGSLEEERRLFYVATTRAKDILILSYAKHDSIKKISYQPSIFLKEAGFKNVN